MEPTSRERTARDVRSGNAQAEIQNRLNMQACVAAGGSWHEGDCLVSVTVKEVTPDDAG